MMARKLFYSILLIIIVVGCFLLYKSCQHDKKNETFVSHDMLVQQVETLGKLEVVRYTIQDLMDFEKKRDWLPNSVTSVKIVGEVTGCVDLTKIKPEDIYTQRDSVSIILPDPEICNWKIDHSKSKVYNVKYGLWETQKLVDEAYQEAEQKLYKEAQNMGIYKTSRENAKIILTPILKGLGFRKINVGFKSTDKPGSQHKGISISKE